MEPRFGDIVAFEGQSEITSTQLRLLLASPNILVLPSVQCYIKYDQSEKGFDAREYIKSVHEAMLVRHREAEDFIQGSTPKAKRLVFMNGGTLGAQALCVRTIMKHQTKGDRAKAESIFSQIAKGGVTGLRSRGETFEQWKEKHLSNESGDPTVLAMRAAEALDRQTAGLQPVDELEYSLNRGRSNSLPLYGYADDLGDAAPFFVFGAQGQDDTESVFSEKLIGVESPRTPRFTVTQYDDISETLTPSFTNFHTPSPMSPLYPGDLCGPNPARSTFGVDGFNRKSDAFSIRSTDNVVYGEASLIDLRNTSRRNSMNRIKSLDRIFQTSPKYRDLCTPSEASRGQQSPDQQVSPVARRPSVFSITSDNDSFSGGLSYIEGPRTILIRPEQSVVMVRPVPKEKKRNLSKTPIMDKGAETTECTNPREPFQPVLPFLEGSVIYFRNRVPDALLDTCIKSYRSNHSIVPQSPKSFYMDEDNVGEPTTPQSQPTSEPKYMQDEGKDAEMASPSLGIEYDPFSYLTPTLLNPKPKPTSTTIYDKIYELNISSQQTAITVQNNLRSVLKAHFPPEAEPHSPFKFPLLPEFRGLWRPVFRDTEPDSNQANNYRLDQILAIGAQRGVSNSYTSEITVRIEKLGGKPSGVTRSGRLDFRYLLAAAMQAYTTQPLASQTYDNPFSNSYLLATLIIPHLETYLALHTKVRFLMLEYPPEHISTVLALQNLIGVDLMKVAQIVDTNSKERLPFTHLRGVSINSEHSKSSNSSSGSRQPSSSMANDEVTLSKANFLLTSSASEAEICTFLSTISEILCVASHFYVPVEEVRTPSSRSMQPAPLFTAFPRSGTGFRPPSMATLTPRYVPDDRSSRSDSIAETVGTYKSLWSRKSHRKAATIDGQSIFTDFDDGEWDQEDRRLMPALMKRNGIFPTGPNRKALRFLGLE